MNRLIRTFIEPTHHQVGEEINLSENEAIHLSRVLRLQKGDCLEALDGRGRRYSSECIEMNRARIKIRIMEVHQEKPALREVRMAIALGKSNKWEEMIRPLTELGVNRLTPLITQRTEAAFDLRKLRDKKIRWQKIAQEACKQSGNAWVPRFDDPLRFSDAVPKLAEKEECWIGSLTILGDKLNPLCNSDRLAIFIGPEGGWSPEEERSAKLSGFNFFTLGSNVLRVETAAVSALAVARQNKFC